jgi:glycosyltransferase involved in cell wall biosynthesis
MEAYERQVCRRVRRVIAVSEPDAQVFRRDYGAPDVGTIATGVDVDYFQGNAGGETPATDLVFVGSMDWMPNIDGVRWFVSKVLPLIHTRRPQTTVAIVGRQPSPDITALGQRDARILITGTVPDVRPWLHGAKASIVPLRIGGGTRLKIYEAMAARVPVVSTTIGAEGLDVTHGQNIVLADTPEALAASCHELLENRAERDRIARCGFEHVAAKYGWDAVTSAFERMIAP